MFLSNMLSTSSLIRKWNLSTAWLQQCHLINVNIPNKHTNNTSLKMFFTADPQHGSPGCDGTTPQSSRSRVECLQSLVSNVGPIRQNIKTCQTNQNATQLKITVLRCDEKNWIRSNKNTAIQHRMTCTKLIGHAACTKVWWNLHLETPNENLSKRFMSQSTCFREFVTCNVKKKVRRQWSTSGPVAWCSTGRYQQCQVATMAGTTWPKRGNDTTFPTWLKQSCVKPAGIFEGKISA